MLHAIWKYEIEPKLLKQLLDKFESEFNLSRWT